MIVRVSVVLRRTVVGATDTPGFKPFTILFHTLSDIFGRLSSNFHWYMIYGIGVHTI